MPIGTYLVTGTLGSLIVERTATATFARSADATSAPPWPGWRLTLPEPITIGSSAIWTSTRNAAGGAELIHIGTIVSVEPVDNPLVGLPGAEDETVELEGTEEWLSTVDEPENLPRSGHASDSY